jgi:hypothetical protein
MGEDGRLGDQVRPEERRLVELEQEIAASKGLITPEQEAEIDAIVVQQAELAADLAVEFEQRHKRLKALIDEAKKMLGFFETRADSYRAKLTYALKKSVEAGGTKSLKADDRIWRSATLMEGKGRVEIVGVVPDEYLKEEMVKKPDTEMIRALLEAAGDQPWAKLVREPHCRILVNEDKILEREMRKELS